MRPRFQSTLPMLLLLLAMGALSACGKRAEPLAPYLKTPKPPSALAVHQAGDSVEIQVTAPVTTVQNRPLPVIELEWIQAPPTGDFRKLARPIFREEVAPGETRTKSFPIPATDARFSVQAYSGGARSTPAPPFPFKPVPVPASPTGVEVMNLPTGIQVTWTNPPGAEPWPTPTPLPTPSPGPLTSPISGEPGAVPPSTAFPTTDSAMPSVSPRPGDSAPASPPGPPVGATPVQALDLVPDPEPPAPALADPSSPPGPESSLASPTPPLGPGAGPAAATLSPSPTPSPTPTPTPALLAGIRIFRTDGAPRLAREPLQAESWLDEAPKTGEKPCYALRYASSITPLVESASTEPVCVEVTDLVAPEPPDRLVGDIGDTFVELSWLPSPSSDVDHYLLYRTMEGEARAMVIQTEGLLLRVRDLRMTSGPRTYEVTAVDAAGNESAPTPPLAIAVP